MQADPGVELGNRPFLHLAGCTDRLTHTIWADEVVLVSEDHQRLQGMAADVARAAQKEELRIATGKLRFWSLARPAKSRVQATARDARAI